MTDLTVEFVGGVLYLRNEAGAGHGRSRGQEPEGEGEGGGGVDVTGVHSETSVVEPERPLWSSSHPHHRPPRHHPLLDKQQPAADARRAS